MRWHRYHVHTFDYIIKGIVDECKRNMPKEVIGFLVGMCCQWRNEYFTLIDDYIPVRGTGSHYHIVMDTDAIADAIRVLSKRYNDSEHLIVGWYHSHPGYGLFLSNIDIMSHITFFNQPYHVALVVDPLRMEYGFFKLSVDGKPIRVSHIVWRRAYEYEEA